MSESKQFRTRPVLLSPSVFDACKVLSEVEGHTCVDEFVDLFLGLALSDRACIKWAVAERKKRMDSFREDYLAKVKAQQQDDQLP